MTAPVELYRIALDQTVYTWTSGGVAVTYNSETYTPEPIGRSGLEQGEEINRANVQIRVPRTNVLAQIFLTSVPEYQATVTIFRQVGATTTVHWKGRVVGSTADQSEVTLECESVFTSLRRTGVRARYQTTCRHVLYGRGCTLDKADFAVPAILKAVNGLVLTVETTDSYPDGYFHSGMVEDQDGVLRYIVGHQGDQITLWREVVGIGSDIGLVGWGKLWGQFWGGIPITLYPGCPHDRVTCKDRFNNLDNFGGWPWIPQRNPMDGSSIV
jgi:uncharacterized phage protein (TIGR02218 family)